MLDRLSKENIEEFRTRLSSSLADTFQVMFNLGIDNDIVAGQNRLNGLSSCIEMTHNGTHALLTISITSEVLKEMYHKLDPDTEQPSAEFMQSLVNEIVNIVSHHLRNYINDRYGVMFDLSLPKDVAQEGGDPSVPNSVLELKFRIDSHEGLKLDLGMSSEARFSSVG